MKSTRLSDRTPKAAGPSSQNDHKSRFTAVIGRLIKLSALVLAATLLATGFGLYRLDEWSETPLSLTQEQVVEFPTGTSLGSLAATLESQKIIDSQSMFRIWIRIFGDYSRFQAGRYRFLGDVSPADVARTILQGDVYHPVVLQFTIPEGFSLRKTLNRLASNDIGRLEELKRLAREPELIQAMGIPSKNLEGYLYPATYSFIKVPSPRDVLEHMVKTFWSKLPEHYEQKVSAMGLSLHQAVTFASLIELETMHDEERPFVSEVIWNRLKDNVPLAIDAAIIYGIKDYQGDLKWKHLKDSNNPYNTRVHRGLPPTPIGSPSRASLEAVLTPSKHGYYYYVLKPDSTRHHFSKTLKEHNQHVRKLVEAGR